MFHFPTKLLWGEQDGESFFKICANKNVCVICSTSQERLQDPIIKNILLKLQQTANKVIIANTACSNPTFENVTTSIETVTTNNCEIIIAIGGGSTIDCAKATAYGVVNGIDNLLLCLDDMSFSKPQAMPLLVLNTSSGTGSEINSCAVITVGNEKKALVCDAIYPALTWLIPELALSLPYEKTVPMFLDCIYHAVEGFVSKNSTFFASEFSKTCITLSMKNLTRLKQCTNSIEIRKELALASLYSALSDTYGGCISIHSLGHAISGIYPCVPHGISISAISIQYYTFLHNNGNLEYLNKEKSLIHILNTQENTFENLGQFMLFLNQKTNVSQYTLSSMGFSEQEFSTIISNAHSSAGVLFENDPVVIRDEDIYTILKQSL